MFLRGYLKRGGSIGGLLLCVALALALLLPALPALHSAAATTPQQSEAVRVGSPSPVASENYPAEGQPGFVGLVKRAQWDDASYTNATVTFDTWGESKQVGCDVVLAMDMSGSMGFFADISNGLTRLDVAKQAAQLFIDALMPSSGSDNRIGVVGFDVSAKVTQPFTNDRTALFYSLDKLSPHSGTDFAVPFEKIIQRFPPRSGHKYYVLFMSDGQPSIGQSNGVKEAQRVKDWGAIVKSFGFAGEAIPGESTDEMAECLLNISSGSEHCYQDLDAAQLLEKYKDVAGEIIDSCGTVLTDRIDTRYFNFRTGSLSDIRILSESAAGSGQYVDVTAEHASSIKMDAATGEVSISSPALQQTAWRIEIDLVNNGGGAAAGLDAVPTNDGDAKLAYVNTDGSDACLKVDTPTLKLPQQAPAPTTPDPAPAPDPTPTPAPTTPDPDPNPDPSPEPGQTPTPAPAPTTPDPAQTTPDPTASTPDTTPAPDPTPEPATAPLPPEPELAPVPKPEPAPAPTPAPAPKPAPTPEPAPATATPPESEPVPALLPDPVGPMPPSEEKAAAKLVLSSTEESIQRTTSADADTPRNGSEAPGAWSLLSLIMSVTAVIVTLLLVAHSLIRRRNEDEDSAARARPESDTRQRKAARATKLAAIALGVLTPLAFIILDDMRLHMAWTNRWTIIIAIIFVLHMAALAVYMWRSRSRTEEEEDEASEAEALLAGLGG